MKKLISFLFVLFIPFMVIALPVGDVDGDGYVKSNDYILVRKHILKNPVLTGDKLTRANVDGKNGVNSADYIAIRKIIMNGGSATPTPKPTATPTPKPTATPTPKPTPVPYVISEDSKFSSYKVIKEYSSSTFKYKIIVDNEQDDYVLIWVADASAQLNSALASSNALSTAVAETILGNEIATYGYQNKGMVAVNASFFENGTPLGGVVFSHGKVVKNTGVSAGVIGITSSGTLKQYVNQPASVIQADGVRNTFVISSNAWADNTNVKANRTQLCQYDAHNYVLFSGSGTVMYPAQKIERITGCKETYNLDGGGSRKLYYKDSSTATMTRRFGGGRALPDMLYFVEK